MLLAINSQKSAISWQMKLVQQVSCKFSTRIHNFKQFKQFKMIISLIQKHLKQLEIIESYNQQAFTKFRIEPYIDASQRIKNHLIRKSKQVKQLINDTTFGPYATLAQASLEQISYNLFKIQEKMQEALIKIQQFQKNSIDEQKTIE